MASHSYKLIYFDSKGRAEPARLLFHAAGVAFEDVRLTKEEFQARKSSYPFEQLPVLEIDGVVYAQSFAIASYLAREFGYYGKSNLESLKIDEVICHMGDMFTMLSNAFHEKDETRKEQFMKEVKQEKLPKALGYLENFLQKNESGYFVGSEMTLADMAVSDFCMTMEDYKVVEISKCPNGIQELIKKVSNHPKLAKYISERK